MNVTHNCPHCGCTLRDQFDESTTQLSCGACHKNVKTNSRAVRGERVRECLVCPSTELFVRKNFPQRLGVTIVGIGILLSCIAWSYYEIYWTFGILVATALIDVALYALVGDVVECYGCHARYSNLPNPRAFEAFDLEVHERHRQKKARVSE